MLPTFRYDGDSPSIHEEGIDDGEEKMMVFVTFT